jgi:hypothetical protein
VQEAPVDFREAFLDLAAETLHLLIEHGQAFGDQLDLAEEPFTHDAEMSARVGSRRVDVLACPDLRGLDMLAGSGLCVFHKLPGPDLHVFHVLASPDLQVLHVLASSSLRSVDVLVRPSRGIVDVLPHPGFESAKLAQDVLTKPLEVGVGHTHRVILSSPTA